MHTDAIVFACAFLLTISTVMVVFMRYRYTKDIIVVLCTLVVLGCIVYWLYAPTTTPTREHFEEVQKIQFLNYLLEQNKSNNEIKTKSVQTAFHQEDLSNIRNNLTMYVSSYSSLSYDGSGTEWKDIANGSSFATPQGENVSRNITFSTVPTFDRESGFFLGSNKATGPMSMSLGIGGGDDFTVFIMCKHKVGTTNASQKLFDIYGNTTNNNGLGLELRNVVVDGFQVGDVVVTFAGHEYTASQKLNLDPDLVSLYCLVKKAGDIMLFVSSSLSNVQSPMITAKLKDPDVLFSNKKIELNSNQNWQGFIKAFGCYNKALEPKELHLLHSHLFNEEKRMDDMYVIQEQQKNHAESKLKALVTCPFDDQTCQSCADVGDWSDTTNVISANTQCKHRIDLFCTKHPQNRHCGCWDKTHDRFLDTSCVALRSTFAKQFEVIKPMSEHNIKGELDTVGIRHVS